MKSTSERYEFCAALLRGLEKARRDAMKKYGGAVPEHIIGNINDRIRHVRSNLIGWASR